MVYAATKKALKSIIGILRLNGFLFFIMAGPITVQKRAYPPHSKKGNVFCLTKNQVRISLSEKKKMVLYLNLHV